MSGEIPCRLSENAAAEWAQIPSGPARDALDQALKDGFPTASIGFGRITLVRPNFFCWDVPHPNAAGAEMDVAPAGEEAGAPTPADFSPLGYRVFGLIEIDELEEEEQVARNSVPVYFLVLGIREIMRMYNFE